MLDTIILTIPKQCYIITNYDKFHTTKESMEYFRGGYASFKNNPTTADKASGIYKPCLTIFRRGVGLYLQIQFSAPKLLFGNNLDELAENDFDKVVNILNERLLTMGVKLFSKKVIENADVISFHPSKNIQLSQGYTATFTIRELAKINISKKFDVDFKNYRNNGQAFQIYAKSHATVLYDKINDLIKSKSRATDKDQTPQQRDIFELIKKKQPHLEILRLEIRLSKKIKMNEILEKVGQAPNPTFKDVFNKDLCQKIVNHYWEEYFKSNLYLFATQNNPQKMLQTILNKHKPIKVKQAVYLVGLLSLCRDDEGIRGFRSILEPYFPNSSWESQKRELVKFRDKISSENWQNYHGFIRDIEKNLKQFNSFKFINK